MLHFLFLCGGYDDGSLLRGAMLVCLHMLRCRIYIDTSFGLGYYGIRNVNLEIVPHQVMYIFQLGRNLSPWFVRNLD